MFLHYEFDRKMCLISYKNSAIKSQSPENRLHFLFCKIHFLISLHFSVKFDPGFMWFRPGMCVVRCNHKHLDYTFVCIITYLERHSVLPLHSQTQSFLEMTWSALPIWQRSFKQRPVHSEAQRALIHAQHKPCLCPLSLSLSLSLTHTFFIYLSPSLLSNRAAKWSTAAVSQPAAVLTRDGRTDDAFRLQTWWGTGAIQVWKPLLSVKVRSQRSDAQCDLDQQFFWTLLSLRITHLQAPHMLWYWIVSQFHTVPLLLYPTSLFLFLKHETY